MDTIDKQVILTDSYLIKSKLENSQYESYHKLPINDQNLKFVKTTQNVLTGLYLSTNSEQYVSCLHGEIVLILVDLRPTSPTYLKHEILNLNSDRPCYVLVPKLYAFGYLSKQNSLLLITETQILKIQIKDCSLNIKIPVSDYIISDDDINNLSLKQIRTLLNDHKINSEYSKIFVIQNGLKHNFNKTVLVTGGAGFIGSHVAILLTRKYPSYKIIVFDKLEECANLKNLNEIKDLKNFQFIKGDICDYESLKELFEMYRFDYVLHFAAQSHVDMSLVHPLRFTKTNVLGTHYLLECSRLYPIEKFIHVSTDEVYGTTDKVPNINQPLEPTNPYACSKLAAENIIKSYQKCYKVPIIITRGNNAYGPHQFVEKVIPKFITRLLKNKKCCIHENCYDSERDFLYVTDTAEAFDLVLHKGVVGEIYNIGASTSVNILELAKKLIVLMGKGREGEENEFIEEVKGRLLNDERYRIDSSRLTELGWKPKVDFEDGLVKTIEWYKSNQDYWENGDKVIDLFCDKI